MRRRRLFSLFLAIVLILLTALPVLAEEEKNSAGGVVDGLDNMVLVAENSYLSLYIHMETTEIAVKQKMTNAIWRSNPLNREADPLAAGLLKQELGSQLAISYYSQNLQLQSMDNYNASIQYGQFDIQEIDHGVKVIYRFGKEDIGIDSIPRVISKERFETLILSQASNEEQEYLKKQYKLQSLENAETEETMKNLKKMYPNIINTDLYALSRYFTDFEIPNVYAMLRSFGYTVDDLIEDNEENEIIVEIKETPSFLIPLQFTLDEENLVVTVPTDEIEYSDNMPLYTIQVLKYFGAADSSQDGYMFVPDGSGALIHLNNGKLKAEPLNLAVYDIDAAIKKIENTYNSERTALPVYGMKAGNSALFAIIEGGDTHANIMADISGRNNSYNYVAAQFLMTPKDEVTMDSGKGLNKMNVFQNKLTEGDLRIRYAFLTDDSASYSGMARTYQQYLVETGVLEKKESADAVPFFLELTGAIQKKKSILGIPIRVVEPLTTYDQAKSILEELQHSGVHHIKLKLSGWFNDGVNHTVPSKIKLVNKLGGKTAFTRLTEYIKGASIELFPDVAFQKIYKNTISFSPIRDAVRYLFKEVALNYKINPASNMLDFEESFHFLLSPLKLTAMIDRFMDDYRKLRIDGLFLRDIGNDLYSDFKSKKQVDREQSKQLLTAELDKLQESGTKIGVNIGNSYSLPYADHIVNIPMANSRYFIEDETVPFYQMVIRGYIDYAGEPLNMSQDYRNSMLKAVETGAGIHYSWIYEENTRVKNTEYDYLFSVNYNSWQEEAVKLYTQLNRDLKNTQGMGIIDHEIIETNVVRTYYENGISVIVNYDDKPVVVEGIKIDGMDYSVLQGNGVAK